MKTTKKAFKTEQLFESLFAYACLVMVAIIVLSSLFMVIALIKNKNNALDFLGTNDIVKNIENYEMNMTSVIYTKGDDGKWQEYQRIHGNENRIWTDMENIPVMLQNAFVAIEDERFYTHRGVDWKRTAGAFLNYLPFVDIYSSNQGGSTITQQLIKNITSDKDKSAMRKLREIGRALALEKIIDDKEVILEAYLNTIALGNGICGVQVAANYYFNKDIKDLTLVESAAIAAITKNPSANNPEDYPERNKERRRVVLDKMLELEMISEQQYEQAYNADVVIDKSQQQNFEIPVNSYFVDALIDNVIADISEKYGYSKDTAASMLYNGGLKIYSTLDSDIQDTMEKVYLNQRKYFSQKSRKGERPFVQSAMTIMDYEGHILGIVGGVGEKTTSRGLNRATSSPRQPGSTMKPLGVYAQAMENGSITYYSSRVDKPLDNYYGDNKKGPKEWYGYYAGNMTVKKALERSANTIPCWILKEDVGINESYNFLTQKLNMRYLNETDKNLASLALGGCAYGITTTESAAAYAIFGNGGKYFKPVTYYKVERAGGELVLNCDIEGEQVIATGTATLMNKMLQNVVYGSEGTGKGIAGYNKMKAYAKTGTSSESNDLWMVAGTPYYVGSVWYGFDQPEKIHNAGAAATVWRTIMSEIHKGLETKEFDLEAGIIKQKYCRYSGMPAGDKCRSTTEGEFASGVIIEKCDGTHKSYAPATDESSTTSSEESSSGTSTEAPTDTPSATVPTESGGGETPSGDNSNNTDGNETPSNTDDTPLPDNDTDIDTDASSGEDLPDNSTTTPPDTDASTTTSGGGISGGEGSTDTPSDVISDSESSVTQ